MNDNYAIEVENLHKSFHLPLEKATGLKMAFINSMRGVKGYKEQKVLDGIGFHIEKGDFFGIVGRNGSGKSTLLKVLAGIYYAEQGNIRINGTLVPFIELGVGFNPELTGRENIYLNGALLGFSTQQVEGMYDEIVDFAELHEFMGQKLKNYSSGMQVRLAFSIAIQAKSDILVLDEVLAVGDEAFQRKCYQYFAKLKREKKTVVLVTHSMDVVKSFCNKAILLENGEITRRGNPAEVAQRYAELNNIPMEVQSNDQNSGNSDGQIEASVEYKLSPDKTKLTFVIHILAKKELEDAVVTFVLNRDSGEVVYRFVSDEQYFGQIEVVQNKPLTIELEMDNIFPNSVFDGTLSIKKSDRSVNYIDIFKVVEFEIINNQYPSDIHWKPKEIIRVY